MTSTAPKPLFSLSLGPRLSHSQVGAAPAINNTGNATKRRLAATLGSDDSEDDDDDQHSRKVQLIGGFDGTPKKQKEPAPMVIPALGNRDWKKEAEMRRGGGGRKREIYVPEEALHRAAGVARGEGANEVENTGKDEVYGLRTFEKKTVEDVVSDETDGVEEKKEITEDEHAIAALMGSAPVGSEMVIARTSDTSTWHDVAPANEDDAFRADVDSRPEVPSLADYAAVPIEEFGAAMLRGMGWKGGEQLGGSRTKDNGGKLRLLEKRPAFLGIGAKPLADIPELGAWGKSDKKKGSRRPETTYIPVVKVDKRTGRPVDEASEETKPSSGGGSSRGGRDRDDGRDSARRDDDWDQRRRSERSSDRPGRGDQDQGRHRGSKRDTGRDSGRDRERERERERDRERRRGGDGGRRRRSRERESGSSRRDRR